MKKIKTNRSFHSGGVQVELYGDQTNLRKETRGKMTTLTGIFIK